MIKYNSVKRIKLKRKRSESRDMRIQSNHSPRKSVAYTIAHTHNRTIPKSMISPKASDFKNFVLKVTPTLDVDLYQYRIAAI